MKTTKSNRKTTPREAVSKQAEESLSLSPERLRDRSSAKTEILNAIMERESRNYNLRHWGINE